MGLTSVAIAILIFGILCAAIGVVCLIGYRRTRQKLGLVGLVPTCAVAELADRLPGEPVELKGIARCATPLTSELAGRPCVYYRSVTTREYLVSGGRGGRRRKSETISENEQRLPFLLEDATGQVAVNPAEAEIDGRKLVDRFEPYRGEPTASITVGGIAIDLPGDARTLGYRWVEHAVPVDAPVYVLGVLQDDGSIGPPPPGSRFRRFLISARSEEELTKHLRQQSWLMLAGAVLSLLVSCVFLATGLAISVIGALAGQR